MTKCDRPVPHLAEIAARVLDPLVLVVQVPGPALPVVRVLIPVVPDVQMAALMVVVLMVVVLMVVVLMVVVVAAPKAGVVLMVPVPVVVPVVVAPQAGPVEIARRADLQVRKVPALLDLAVLGMLPHLSVA